MARTTQHAAARRATPPSIADRLNRQARAFLHSDRHSARRVLIDDIREDKRGWAQHGIAALAVSVLGLGVAGSVALTGAAEPQQAQDAQTKVEVSVESGVTKPAGFDRDTSTSRDETRSALTSEKITSRAEQRAEALTKADEQVKTAAQLKAVRAREKSLKDASKAAQKQAVRIAAARSTSRDETRSALTSEKITSRAEQRAEALTKADEQVKTAAQLKAVRAREKSLKDASKAAQKQAVRIAAARSTSSGSGGSRSTAAAGHVSDLASNGKSCLPVTGGYTIAARFGQVGPWARYHTGMDFSAPVGTRIHAPASGVVINAGSGPASGWAGTYVAIRYADGTQSLSAHMSSVSVSVGQTVSPCQVVGAVGMTGRTFGPHLHFEIYPAGATPGDVYQAVNPEPWLRNRALNP